MFAARVGSTNLPPNYTGNGIIVVRQYYTNSAFDAMIAFGFGTPGIYYRNKKGTVTWSDWEVFQPTGLLSALNTTNKSSVVSAINEVNANLDGKLNNKMIALPEASDPRDATTVGFYTVKNPLSIAGVTGSFNFVLMQDNNNQKYRSILGVSNRSIIYIAHELDGVWSDWKVLQNTGFLGDLKTKEQNTIVGAINELQESASASITRTDWTPTDLGLPYGGSRNVSFGSSAAAAISNSVITTTLKGVIHRSGADTYDFFGTAGNNSDLLSGKIVMARYTTNATTNVGVWGEWRTFNIGDMNTLKTSNKNTIVDAVNEVNSKSAYNYGWSTNSYVKITIDMSGQTTQDKTALIINGLCNNVIVNTTIRFFNLGYTIKDFGDSAITVESLDVIGNIFIIILNLKHPYGRVRFESLHNITSVVGTTL